MSATDQLAALLASHGVRASRRGDWLVPEGSSAPPICALMSPIDAGPNGATARLDVEVAFPEGRRVRESFAGLGSTAAEAESNAFDNFCQSSLHVLLAAFYGHSDPEQVATERWTVTGGQYDAFIGNYTVRSFQGKGTPIPEHAFSVLETAVRSLPSTQDVYWVRLFYCNQGDGTQVTEALLNNEEWGAARVAIAALPWERHPWFYSARVFLVLRRSTSMGATV
jgi:hypothetical protein